MEERRWTQDGKERPQPRTDHHKLDLRSIEEVIPKRTIPVSQANSGYIVIFLYLISISCIPRFMHGNNYAQSTGQLSIITEETELAAQVFCTRELTISMQSDKVLRQHLNAITACQTILCPKSRFYSSPNFSALCKLPGQSISLILDPIPHHHSSPSSSSSTLT